MRAGLTIVWLLLCGAEAAAQTPPLPREITDFGSLASDPVVPPELAALRARYSVRRSELEVKRNAPEPASK